MIGEVPASTVARSSPAADKKYTLPLAPAAMISPPAAVTTLFRGLGMLCTYTPTQAVSQIRMVQSYPTLMTTLPSGENATPRTIWGCPSVIHGAATASVHTLTVISHTTDV